MLIFKRCFITWLYIFLAQMKLSFYASIRLNNFLAKLSSSSVFLSTGTIGNNHLLLVSALGALSLQLSCIVQCPHAIYLFLLKKSICITLVYLTIFVVRLVSVGNLEAAVSLLLSTSPESSYFYANALRAVALSSAVSRSLLELAVKVCLIKNMHFGCLRTRHDQKYPSPVRLLQPTW